ncbi:Uncharacterised protein [Segatella oris]|uniref:Uncharacterized protein n=1 Tax=Segatella oris TaxID=28135 RepID=A0A448L3J6_9BACT|nr:Uncharacterised protein [Segatella oris]
MCNAYYCFSYSQFGTSYALKSLICVMHIIVFHIRNSVRVVLLKAPCWQAKQAYVGIK